MRESVETSKEALVKFTKEGKKDKHHKIIVNTLKRCQYSLTGYGIAQRCILNYNQVMRRTLELELLKIIEQDGKKIDLDGSRRVAYKLIVPTT